MINEECLLVSVSIGTEVELGLVIRGVTSMLSLRVAKVCALLKWTLPCEKLIHNMITYAKRTPLQ